MAEVDKIPDWLAEPEEKKPKKVEDTEVDAIPDWLAGSTEEVRKPEEVEEVVEEPVAPSVAENLSTIASKYKLDPEWVKSRATAIGHFEATGDAGKDIPAIMSSTANQVLGEGMLGGLPSFLYKKLVANDEEAKAMDEIRDAVEAGKSGWQKTGEFAAGLVGPGGPAKAASKLRAALQVGGLGAVSGVANSKEGEELKTAFTGAASSLVMGPAIKALSKLPGKSLEVVKKGLDSPNRWLTEKAIGLTPKVKKQMERQWGAGAVDNAVEYAQKNKVIGAFGSPARTLNNVKALKKANDAEFDAIVKELDGVEFDLTKVIKNVEAKLTNGMKVAAYTNTKLELQLNKVKGQIEKLTKAMKTRRGPTQASTLASLKAKEASLTDQLNVLPDRLNEYKKITEQFIPSIKARVAEGNLKSASELKKLITEPLNALKNRRGPPSNSQIEKKQELLQAYGVVENEIMSTIGQAKTLMGNKELLNRYVAAKKGHGTLNDLIKSVEGDIEKAGSSPILGLKQLIVAASIGDLGGAAAVLAGSSVAKKYGAGFAAKSLAHINYAISNGSGSKLGRWAKVLDKASQSGADALARVHASLLKTDPEYANAINNFIGE